MVAIEQPQYITPTEYMEQELIAEEKSEYFSGVVVAMSGASLEHNRIAGNCYASFHQQLTSSGCEPFPADMRIAIEGRRYFYPDVSVVCGKPEFERLAGGESLTNPILVVEVMSDSTELHDRSVKLLAYLQIPTLQHYLLVSQTAPQVELYTRVEGGWFYTLHKGLEGEIALTAINCSLKLVDIYARVSFDSGALSTKPE